MNDLAFNQDVGVDVNRIRKDFDTLMLGGKFKVSHWRDGVMLEEQPWKANGITDEGKKKILNLYFYETDVEVPDGATYGVYIGLINTGAALDPTDIYATHAGWTEYANYKVAAADKRGEWGGATGAATGAGTVSITNAVAITYDIDGAGGTVYGIFVVSGTIAEIELQSNVDAGNVLWATGAFAAEIPVVSGDQLKITYTVNC